MKSILPLLLLPLPALAAGSPLLFAAALAGVSDEPPSSWEEAAARLVELIQSLKSQFG